MKELRILEAGFDRESSRRWASMTLILICPDGTWFDNTMGGKDKLVASWSSNGGQLLLAWNGQYKTDIFKLEAEDIDKAFPST